MRGYTTDSSNIFTIRTVISSHPCALLLFNGQIIDKTSCSVNMALSMLLLTLHSNEGNALVILMRVH